jgi:Uma2 family endonuclease
LDNEPQPDAVLLIEEQAGGQARLSEDDYIEGAPELVVEIAASSAAIALGDQKRAYRDTKGWLHHNIPHLCSS